MQYDDIDREIVRLIQGDLALVSRPYENLARQMGISEAAIVARINTMQERGLIRRFGAVLRHQKAGYTVNAMVAWKIDNEGAEQAGTIMATYNEISHCYLREVQNEFAYNLFSMIHAKSDDELSQLLGDISQATGIKDYTVLKSVRELKKQSMQYF